MELSLDTFIEESGRSDDESVGRSTVSIGDESFVKLAELESALKEATSDEILVDAASHHIDLQAPSELGRLGELKVRVFLDPESQLGVFHLIAKRESDAAEVFTEPTMIRMVAL